MLTINRDNYKEMEIKIYNAFQRVDYNDMCYNTNDIQRYLCGVHELESFLQLLHDNGINLVREFPNREYTIDEDFAESNKDFSFEIELQVLEHYMNL